MTRTRVSDATGACHWSRQTNSCPFQEEAPWVPVTHGRGSSCLTFCRDSENGNLVTEFVQDVCVYAVVSSQRKLGGWSQCHLLTRALFSWFLGLYSFLNCSVFIMLLLCVLYRGVSSCSYIWAKLLLLPFTTDATSWYPRRPGWSPQNHPSPQSLGSGRTLEPHHTQSYRAASILLIKITRSIQSIILLLPIGSFSFYTNKYYLFYFVPFWTHLLRLLLRKIHCVKALYWVKTFSSLFNHGSQNGFQKPYILISSQGKPEAKCAKQIWFCSMLLNFFQSFWAGPQPDPQFTPRHKQVTVMLPVRSAI